MRSNSPWETDGAAKMTLNVRICGFRWGPLRSIRTQYALQKLPRKQNRFLDVCQKQILLIRFSHQLKFKRAYLMLMMCIGSRGGQTSFVLDREL